MSEHRAPFATRPPAAKVTKDKVVTLRYALFDTDTRELLESRDDLSYLHGGYERRLPLLQQAVDGAVVGFKTELALRPEDAFGEHDPELVMTIQTSRLPVEVRHVGAAFEAKDVDGKRIRFRLTQLTADRATLDGNHPLAGRRLRFIIEVMDVRDALAQELEAGYAFRRPGEAPPPPRRH